MELHQFIGLVAIQVAIVPAAYSIRTLGSAVLHAMADRRHGIRHRVGVFPGRQADSVDHRLATLAIWATLNAMFALMAGIL